MPNAVSLESLPARLRSQLKALGRKYGREGVELFVFGSLARKDGRFNSDLDLGVEWRKPASPKLFRQICRDVDDLPTVRKVDLVDFSKATPRWRKIAGRHRVSLSSR